MKATEECVHCDGARPATREYDGEPACDRCADRLTDEAHARFVAAFYGDAEPFTSDERSHRRDGSR